MYAFSFLIAGVMLAHLHELQSENRTMQSRIMELASQREFYIAINTRLRQTLADGTASLPNGLQPSGNNETRPHAPTNPALQPSPDFHRSASGDRVSFPSPSPSLPAPSSAGSLSKQDQESLLHAHFLASSLPSNYLPSSQTNKSHPTPTNAHHPIRNTESPGFKHERQSRPHSLVTYEHPAYGSHVSDHLQSDDEQTKPGLYSITHSSNSIHGSVPSYVPMATSEMDTLSGEHPQSVHGQKH